MIDRGQGICSHFCSHLSGGMAVGRLNLERARSNMIKCQIRPWEMFDQSLPELLSEVRREDFVPPAYLDLAFADMEIPFGVLPGQAMLSPRIEARMLQAIAIKASDVVLEIGAGSGFMAALLAARAEFVRSVEIVPEIARFARANLRRADVVNVRVETGNAAHGWAVGAPYDAIVVSGSLSALPATLLGQLKVGGRLVAVVGEFPVMQMRLVTRDDDEVFTSRAILETVLAPLVDAAPRREFVL